MSVKSLGWHNGPLPSTGDIIRSAVLKKMKTSRKKYFVLRAETPDALARLEYYDSEKKFRAGLPPKKCIPLKTCFNINKKQDSKHKNVIALYTKDECFCVVFDGEEELKVWLKDFLTLQHGEEILEGEVLKPKFEYVWQVTLCQRGLGAGRTGLYRLCLTDKTITLVKIDEPIPTVIEVSLASVRSCGNLKNFFVLEVGRMSEIGAGEIWFEADDSNIALNIQTTVTHRFKLARERNKTTSSSSTENADLQPKGRIRSASATESSKSGGKKFNPIMSSKHALPQGFRDRCESMPSRPRTSSEGNHGAPGWGKPYLVPYRAHHLRDASHSPPTGSPISPPSDSTGSSYSLPDEHDSLHEMEHQRMMYTTVTPEEVIAEEDYPESPRANPSKTNYVPMNFSGTAENYTEMTPGQYGGHNYASNSASTNSMTSGTPSTDIRLSEYPLDKVFSYVSADDDDTRQCRAYSVGSKPPEAPLAGTPENARVRAFSVGSKTKKYFNRVLPSHHHIPGVKSSSAPLLAPNPRMGSSHSSINNPMDDLMEMDFSSNDTSRSRSSTNASGSSDARSSCNHKNSSCSSTKGRLLGFLEHLGVPIGGDHKKSTHEGYVEMKPGSRTVSGSSDVTPYVDMTQGRRATAAAVDASLPPKNHINSPYLDMSGNAVVNNVNNVPLVGHPYSPYLDMSGNNGSNNPQVGNGNSPYMDMSGGNNAATKENYLDMSGSSPLKNSSKQSGTNLPDYIRQFGRNPLAADDSRHDYMDMNQRQRANSNSSATSRTATSPGSWIADHNIDYLDMSGQSRRSERTNSFGSQMSSSPHFDVGSPKDHVPFGIQSRTPEGSAGDKDGYVQMTPGDFSNIGQPGRHQRQNSTDSTDNEYGDYLNMSGMNMALSATKTDTKGRSQPIAIQTTSGNTVVKNSSPISISSLLGRKSSPTPKMHLPLSPYSSLPRQKSPRKTSSQAGGSMDSSVSSSVTTTPSSSSTMFPISLNSPISPLGGPSKTGTPTTSSMKVPASVLNVPYKSGNSKKKINDDYTMMDFEMSNKPLPLDASRVEDSPYMNYCPPAPNSRVPRLHSVDADEYTGDYAVMKPGVFPIKPTTLPRAKGGASPSGLASPLTNYLSVVGLSTGFMPIREKDERMCSPKPGDLPDKLTHEDKTLETANMEFEDNSSQPYDRLKSPATNISRPNADNAKTPGAQRPPSTMSSEKNSSRPSSVCSDGLASRLGSNSSVYSSNSSASTVVGVSIKPDQPESDQPQQQIVRLHYASLDLSPSESTDDRRSPRTLKNASSEASLNDGQTTTFIYADIDFVKSGSQKESGAVSSSSGGGSGTAVKN